VVLGDVLAPDPTLVIARLVARGWMRYRTDGHRTPHSRCRSVDTVPVADTRQPDDPTSY
jgi:hypothetical protein